MDDATRYQLLTLLAKHPDINQRELADRMGVSLGKANYCLKALIEKGMVKVDNFRQKADRRVYAYLLTPEGVQEKARVTVRFLQHKIADYDALKVEIATLRREVDSISDPSLDSRKCTG